MVAGVNVTDSLVGNCSVLLANSSAYLPSPSALVKDNFSLLPNTSQLVQLNDQIEQILDLDPVSFVEESRDGYQSFLLALVRLGKPRGVENLTLKKREQESDVHFQLFVLQVHGGRVGFRVREGWEKGNRMF